jgi:hypothetical protein
MAFSYNWPPGSWDHVSLPRMARLFEGAQRYSERMRRPPDGEE